jgi:hypothetical protein
MLMECKCDMRTKLVGDGCEVCNPGLALDYAKITITDLQDEVAELKKLARLVANGNFNQSDVIAEAKRLSE